MTSDDDDERADVVELDIEALRAHNLAPRDTRTVTTHTIDYLREHGPSRLSKFSTGGVSPEDRARGVWQFNAARGRRGSTTTSGDVHGVWYLRDEHNYETVVEAWMEANEKTVRQAPRKAIRRMLRDAGPEFHPAIDAVFPASNRPSSAYYDDAEEETDG